VFHVERGVGRLEDEGTDSGAPSEADAYYLGATGSAPIEAERLAFEAWVRGHAWSLDAQWNGKGYSSRAEVASRGNYVCPQAMMVRRMWAAWRDRAALARLKTPNASLSGGRRPSA
jgi:hypothetical protein